MKGCPNFTTNKEMGMMDLNSLDLVRTRDQKQYVASLRNFAAVLRRSDLTALRIDLDKPQIIIVRWNNGPCCFITEVENTKIREWLELHGFAPVSKSVAWDAIELIASENPMKEDI